MSLKELEGYIFYKGRKEPSKSEVQRDVNHPDHYNSYPIEVIDMMVKIWGVKKVIDFCYINAFKYRMRAGLKGSSETDLKKELWYIEKARELEKQQTPTVIDRG